MYLTIIIFSHLPRERHLKFKRIRTHAGALTNAFGEGIHSPSYRPEAPNRGHQVAHDIIFHTCEHPLTGGFLHVSVPQIWKRPWVTLPCPEVPLTCLVVVQALGLSFFLALRLATWPFAR